MRKLKKDINISEITDLDTSLNLTLTKKYPKIKRKNILFVKINKKIIRKINFYPYETEIKQDYSNYREPKLPSIISYERYIAVPFTPVYGKITITDPYKKEENNNEVLYDATSD